MMGMNVGDDRVIDSSIWEGENRRAVYDPGGISSPDARTATMRSFLTWQKQAWIPPWVRCSLWKLFHKCLPTWDYLTRIAVRSLNSHYTQVTLNKHQRQLSICIMGALCSNLFDNTSGTAWEKPIWTDQDLFHMLPMQLSNDVWWLIQQTSVVLTFSNWWKTRKRIIFDHLHVLTNLENMSPKTWNKS